MMSTKLDWTQKLGDAVLAQQPDVMDAIQRLRTKADANKKLTSTKEQKVTKKQEQGKRSSLLSRPIPNTVYVPYYDPAVAYGGWPYPSYPPYYFPPSWIYCRRTLLRRGIAFGAGYALGRWASGGNYWGGEVNWSNNNINVNRSVNINTGGNTGSTIRNTVRASNTTTPTCSRSSETAIFVAEPESGGFPRPQRRAGPQTWRRSGKSWRSWRR